MSDLSNMAFLARLGTTIINAVAATTILLFFFVSVDKNGLKVVMGKLIGQSTSKKLANLPPCLQRVKAPLLVQHIADNSLFSSLLLGLLVGGLAIVFPEEILELSGAEHAVAVHGAPYFQIIMGCIIVSSLASSLTSTLNGLKEQKRVTIAAGCMLLTHIVLGSLAVYVFDLGLKGVAWANVVAIVVQVVMLARLLAHRGFSSRVIRPNWRLQWYICKEAWPLVVDKLSFQACIAVYWHVLQHHGSDVLASQRVANQIMLVPLALFVGMYAVISPYVAEYYGDEDYKSIRSFTTKMFCVGTVFCGVVLLTTSLVGSWVSPLFFPDDKSLLEMTQGWLLFLVLVHGSNTALQIVTHTLKAVGSKGIVLLSSLLGNGLWAVSLYIWGKTTDVMIVSCFQVVATLLKLIILGWHFYTQKWVPKPEVLLPSG
jgi:Na+-driven multidrug efflux pump